MNNRKDFWKWLLNLLISILTALAAALGTASCVRSM